MIDYCFRLCKSIGFPTRFKKKKEKIKQQKNLFSFHMSTALYILVSALENEISKFQIIRQSIFTQFRPQLLTPTHINKHHDQPLAGTDRQGGGGDSLQMRRMRRIRLDMRGRLQNRYKSHIKPLSPRNRNRQWGIRLDRKETGDLAHHGLAFLGPGGELSGCDALFEAEEDCFLC